jgi:hypothetical protein
MSFDMTYEERRRYEAYLASQDHFEDVSEQTAAMRIRSWLATNVPHILRAIEAAYRLAKGAYDLYQVIRSTLGW